MNNEAKQQMYRGYKVEISHTSVFSDIVRYKLSSDVYGEILVDAPQYNEENKLAIFDQQIDAQIKRKEKRDREAMKIEKEIDEVIDKGNQLLPPLTKRQCAVISTYTGILIGKFEWTHEYIEEIMGRPVWTHELGDKAFYETVKVKAKDDFIRISDYAIGYNAPLGGEIDGVQRFSTNGASKRSR